MIELFLTAIRVLLAIVLTVAASGKLADPAGSRSAFTDLGGPAALASMGAWLLPLCEIATALALLTPELAMPGAIAALALFTVFTVVLAAAMARGSTADCHCFGQLKAAPVSGRTVTRTGVLAGLAGMLVIAGRDDLSPGILGWLATAAPVDVRASALFVAAVGLVTWMVAWVQSSRRREAALVERIETLERRVAADPATSREARVAEPPSEGLPIGARAPLLTPPTAKGKAALIVFVSASCPPCEVLLPRLEGWRERLGGAAELRVVSRDDDEGRILAEVLGARWTPAGVLVNGSGRIASPMRYGTDVLQELLEALANAIHGDAVDDQALHRHLGSRLGSSAVLVGDPAPLVDLFDAAGRRYASPTGQDTLFLFWDPSCMYCQGMSEELKAYEAAAPVGTPGVTFVIPREAAVASAQQAGFSSPSVFDPGSALAPLYGASGTPAAVLVDRQGRIASTVALGKDAVLALLAPAATPMSAP